MDLSLMYEEHVSRVFGFFAYRVQNVADAEDLTALTFERAVRHAGRYDRRRASVSTWLLAIAQNVLVDHFRRAVRHREHLWETADFDDVPDRTRSAVSTSHGLDPHLEVALKQLSERERTVIALRFGGELRGKEIASLLGLTEPNVHQILSRSLRQLRNAMPTTAVRSSSP